MQKGFSVGGAAGLARLRAAFRGEGFLVPDVYAQVAERLCGGKFTAEMFLAERDELGARYLASPDEREAMKARGPLEKAFENAQDAITGRLGMPTEIWELIEAEKIREFKTLPNLSMGTIKSKSDSRKAGEEIGRRNGFSLLKNSGRAGGRLMFKESPRTGLRAYFNIETGGHSHGLYPGPLLNLMIGHENLGPVPPAIHLFLVVTGLICYSSGRPLERLIADRFADGLVAAEVASDFVKLGLLARIRLFDLLFSLIEDNFENEAGLGGLGDSAN